MEQAQSSTPSAVEFDTVYNTHVEMVVNGDLKGVMADMDPAVLATVFEGVQVPRGQVDSATVVSAVVDGDRATGEAVYQTPDATIGLRSGWRLVEGRWLADRLENFAAGPREQ